MLMLICQCHFQIICAKNFNVKEKVRLNFSIGTAFLASVKTTAKQFLLWKEDLKSYLQNQSKNVQFYVYETAETKYYNKKGEQTSYTCTTRVDKQEKIEIVINNLQSLATKYLLHRFFVINDKCFLG